MKKTGLALLLIGITCFMMITTGNKTTIAKGELDLLKIASVLHDEDILINGWSLHAREKLEDFQTLEEVKNYGFSLKEKFPNWTWDEESESDMWNLSAEHVTKEGRTETIQLLSTHTKSNPQTYIIYEAKGKIFNEETEHFLEKQLSEKFSVIFRQDATIFSCIKGEFNDNINESLPLTVKNLLKAFKAKEIEALNEETFVSTSAYSPLFAESITTNEQDMNLQLGVRKQGLGARTTLVVGTPIITIEY
ncbi:YwmB family TATA-box binding protein [Cytobacillus sp. FJAT-54145]|uniref:YwmB family TATA-box binding protein n=1 Tax=Cytobacillus spartinae TaxID=3299023 RepID=A0ABW6KC65_9BACI